MPAYPPSLSPLPSLQTNALDAAMAARYTDKRGALSPIPAGQLRLLVALVLCSDAPGCTNYDADPWEPFLARFDVLTPFLSARKRTSERPGLVEAALSRNLRWLHAAGLVEAELPDGKTCWRVSLALDENDGIPPRFEHARQIAVEGLTLHRLAPSPWALLARMAYAADADGVVPPICPRELSALVALDPKTVRKVAPTLGLAHGVAAIAQPHRGGSWHVRLCQPTPAAASPQQTCPPVAPIRKLSGRSLEGLHHTWSDLLAGAVPSQRALPPRADDVSLGEEPADVSSGPHLEDTPFSLAQLAGPEFHPLARLGTEWAWKATPREAINDWIADVDAFLAAGRANGGSRNAPHTDAKLRSLAGGAAGLACENGVDRDECAWVFRETRRVLEDGLGHAASWAAATGLARSARR